jgi:serine/threonine protein kinase
MSPGSPVLSPGTRLGRYEIRQFIDFGGMGDVYRAWDGARFVAIKVLRPDAARDPRRLQRFNNEWKVLAKFNHPRVCAFFHFDSDKIDGADIHYLVMEYCDGDTLAQRLSKGRLRFDEVLSTARQIAEGLAVAHAGGVVHRDLTPRNIKLTPAGVKLLDFGVAKLRAECVADPSVSTQDGGAGRDVTGDGKVVGTWPYMSPEQASGRDDIDARADVFAFGAIAYEMLTGTKAFDGATAADVCDAVSFHHPPPNMGWKALVSGLRRLVDRSLQKEASRRPSNGHELRNALRRIIRWWTLLKRACLGGLVSLPLIPAAWLLYVNLPFGLRDGQKYGFEPGTMGWAAHQYTADGRSNVVQRVDRSTQQSRSGEASLRVDVIFKGPDEVAEVALDKVIEPEGRRGIPIDLSNHVVQAYVWFPADFPVVANHPPTARLFLKDSSRNLRSFYGCTENISVGDWIALTIDTRQPSSSDCRVGQTEMQDGFDLSSVQIVGIQVAPNSEGPLVYDGHFLVDDVHWTSATAFSACIVTVTLAAAHAIDIAETIIAAIDRPRRVLWPELAIFAGIPWQEN